MSGNRNLRRGVPVGMALAALLLAGCEANPDPARGGFASGVAGLSSGSYQARLDQKEAELTAAEAERAALEEEAAIAEREQTRVSSQVDEAEKRLAKLRRDVAKLEKQIANASRQQRLSGKELAALEAEVQDLRLARNLLESDPVVDIETKRQRIAKLEKRQRLLEETLADALG